MSLMEGIPKGEGECKDNDYGDLSQHALCTENDFSFSTTSQLRREFKKFYGSILYTQNKKCLTNSGNISINSDYLLQEYAYEILGILLRNKTMNAIQLNSRSIDLFCKFLKLHRTIRGITGLCNFISQHSSFSESRSTTVFPSGKSILNFIEGVSLRTSLFITLASLDGAVSRVSKRIVNHRQVKSIDLSETIVSHSTSFKKMNSRTVQSEDFRYESNSQKICIICPSTDSSSSHQSISSASFSLSKGTLHCTWKGGMPYFLFSAGDDSADVLVTCPRKQEPYAGKALDYIYTFHSKKAVGRGPRNIDNHRLEYVGKMKVSSSLIINSDLSTLLETEFVLVGCSKGRSVEMKSSNPAKCSSALSKNVLKRLKTTHQFRNKPVAKLGRLNSRNEESTRKQFHYASYDFSEADSGGDLDNDFSPNLEMASIIVKNHHHNNVKEDSLSGWGFNFLRSATSLEIHQDCGYKDCGLVKGIDAQQSIHVLIPDGFHGGRTSETGGPSSLTHRWRSRGSCDCGGWDVGCPLTVFSNTPSSHFLIKDESEEDNREDFLFIEGAKHKDPVLRLVNVNGGALYDIYFRSTLSALQSFAIAVAIIHAKVPSLCPKL